jgi:hypothetical protein
MSSDPKKNSVVGQFNQKATPALRESYELLGAVPVAIEALTVENVGNNCIWDPKPHIINATNVDTESVIGQIGINKIKSIVTEQQSSASWKTILYDDIDDNGIPESAGDAIYYRIVSIVWIGELFNGESDEDAYPFISYYALMHDNEVSDVFVHHDYCGMDHMIPSQIDINIGDIINSNYPSYLLRVPTVGASCSIFGMSSRDNFIGECPRSFLLLSFPIILLTTSDTPLGWTSLSGSSVAEISSISAEEGPVYGSLKEALLPARIRDHFEIFDVGDTDVTYPITIEVTDVTDTPDVQTKRITASSYNPNISTIYCTIVYPGHVNYSTFTVDDVTYSAPGIPYQTDGFYVDVTRTCKVVLAQRLSDGTIVKSDLELIEITLSTAYPPVVRFWETWDSETHIFSDEITGVDLPATVPFYVSLERDVLAGIDEIDNTYLAFGLNQLGIGHLTTTGNLYIGYGDDYDYGDHNPITVIEGDVSDNVANIYVQTVPMTPPVPGLEMFEASEVLSYIGLVDEGSQVLPMPIVTPPTAVVYIGYEAWWPELYVHIPSDLIGSTAIAVRYAWRQPGISMDPTEGLETEDFDEGTGWDVIQTITMFSGINDLRVYYSPYYGEGASVTRNMLYICFTKTGWDSPTDNIGKYDYTILPSVDTKGVSDGTPPLADGFDNKLVIKRVETLQAPDNVIRLDISTLAAPAINANYLEDLEEDSYGEGEAQYLKRTVPEKMYYRNNLPGFSQTFFVMPSLANGQGVLATRRSCILTMLAKHRKQTSTYGADIDVYFLDQYTEKKRTQVYSSDDLEIYLNLYKESMRSCYRYCFSVVNVPEDTETCPNNFTADELLVSDEPSVCITRVQVIDEITAGICRAVITYTVSAGDSIYNNIAYLELSYLSDYYPRMSALSFIPSILTEVIVNSDTMLPSKMISSTSNIGNMFIGVPIEYELPPLSGLRRFFKREISHAHNLSQVISARLFIGNSLALGERSPSERSRKLYIDTMLSYGANIFAWNDYHCSSAHFPWDDGIERYANVACMPVVFPMNSNVNGIPLMRYPEVGYTYAYYCGGNGSIDNQGDLTGWVWKNWDTHPFNYNGQSYYETITMRTIYDSYLDWKSKLIGSNGEPYTGTLFCIQPPAVLPGGAYNATGIALTELNLELIKKGFVYGDEVGQATLSSAKGVFSLSSWPYMSDISKRVSAMGLSSQSIILENYIFSIENGYACVYFINEKQGKSLLFNELGAFIDFPLIFKGAPYFGVANTAGIIIYRFTDQGVFPIRKFNNAQNGLMFHISGHNPTVLIKVAGGYQAWAIDTNAVYDTGLLSFSNDAVIKRITTPEGTTVSLVTGQVEHLIETATNYTMSIESSEIYPSMLSYEYEKFTFVVNGVIVRFDSPANVYNITNATFSMIIKANNLGTLHTVSNARALSEVKICLDAIPVKSLSYTMTSRVPIRSVRFVGHFVEDLKVE